MGDIVDAVVERFRDASVGLADWSQALGLIAEATGAHMGQLAGMSRYDASTVNHTSGISPDQLDAYFEARADDPAVNPRVRGLLAAAPGRCITEADFLDPAAREASPIYAGLFHRCDVPHAAGLRLDTPKDLTVGVVVLRSGSAGAPGRRETELLRLAGPGIAGAVQAAVALGALQDRTVLDTAESLSGAAILLDCDRRIVSLSPGAEAVLRAGWFLTAVSNRLVATHAASGVALDRAIAAAVRPSSLHKRRAGRVILMAKAGGPSLPVDLCPLPVRLSGPISQAQALLTMRLPHAHDLEVRRAALTAAFGLTPAEAGVALLLADGHDLARIAARRGTSVGTVRSQLKVIFEKTHTRRQAELAVLVQRFH